ncbi:Rieske (2Fe-2S) protein [candidate division KSB1 bacterium]|nr:Rieske (2Fe-2S) protein [candidate division KSB1 bacterium]
MYERIDYFIFGVNFSTKLPINLKRKRDLPNPENTFSHGKPVSSHREFMKKSIKGAEAIAIGVIAASLANGCSSTRQAAATTGPTVTVDISDAANRALATVGGSIALESNILDEAEIYVVRESESSVRAFSRECAHNGYTLPAFSGGTVICGCHGSGYDASGNVLNGPATRALKQYKATISGNVITVSAQ